MLRRTCQCYLVYWARSSIKSYPQSVAVRVGKEIRKICSDMHKGPLAVENVCVTLWKTIFSESIKRVGVWWINAEESGKDSTTNIYRLCNCFQQNIRECQMILDWKVTCSFFHNEDHQSSYIALHIGRN